MTIKTAVRTDICGAQRRQGEPGELCRHTSGWGTDHPGIGRCKLHGGSSPGQQLHVQRVLADMNLRKQLATMAIPLEGPVDPQQILLQLIREAAGNVAFLGARIAELSEKDDELDRDTLEDKEATPGEGGRTSWRNLTGYHRGAGLFGPKIDVDKDGDEHVVGEEYRGMVRLYGEWYDRLAKVSKMAVDANISKEQVAVAKEQGQTIVVIVNRVLTTIGLAPEQMAQARTLIAEEFRVQSQLPAGEERER